ncbi:MAG: TetR/AcrR family transcriptional regulator [Aestuariivirga sp.]
MIQTQLKSRRPGRAPSEKADAHAAIMDAVYELLQTRSARDLTMEMIAKRAKVGKPTLYKWWPSKAALILAMFSERLQSAREFVEASTAEQALRNRVRRLIKEFNGFSGKLMADLIAEGQSEPSVLLNLYDQHINHSRDATIAEINQAKTAREFRSDVDAALLVDSIFSPIYFRLLLRSAPLTEQYGDELVEQVLRGVR